MSKENDDKKKHGIRALNQEFRRYEQVTKEQAYGLSEIPDRDEFDDEFRIRTCDMRLWFEGGEGRRRFVQELGEAMESIGFAILTDHGLRAEFGSDAAFVNFPTPGTLMLLGLAGCVRRRR